MGLLHPLLQRRAHGAVGQEGLVGGGRDGVDGVGTDEQLHVEQLRQRGVLGARRGPQQSLRTGTGGDQSIPAPPGEELAGADVDDLGVGDGHLAMQGALQPRFNRQVEAAHEDARHRGYAADAASRGEAVLQTGQIRLHRQLVGRQAKQQGDVHVDGGADQRLYGGNPLGGSGHLHHQIGPIDRRPEPFRLGDRGGGVVGQLGGDLHAHVAVVAATLVVDAPEDVSRGADVGDGEELIGRLGVHRPRLAQLCDGLCIVARPGDGLGEDRRVGGHPPQAVHRDHPLELPGGEQRAADVVVPDALAQREGLVDRVGHGFLLHRSS